jgi:hypothetical protein
MIRRLDPETLVAIVTRYRGDQDARAVEEEVWRAKGKSFAYARNQIARAQLGERRHPHQRRLGAQTLADCVGALERISIDLEEAPDFHSVFTLVEKAFRRVWGAGELMTYDTADRLALRRGFAPNLVYLHAGTRTGARRLCGPFKRHEAWSIFAHQLPYELHGLSTREAEDVLCIYKDHFFDTEAEFAVWCANRRGDRCVSGRPSICC